MIVAKLIGRRIPHIIQLNIASLNLYAIHFSFSDAKNN